MLRSEKQLEGLTIGATDGTIGKVKDFYFDDEAWVIRYMVADTSKWLGGRDVLISPYSLGQPDWDGRALRLLSPRHRSLTVLESTATCRSHVSSKEATWVFTAIRTTGEAADYGAKGSIRAPIRLARASILMTAIRVTCVHHPTAMAIATRICAAATRCADITLLPPTARSAMSRDSWSTMPHGPFVT